MEKSDIKRVTASFNKSVGMFLRSFGSCSTNVKWNLFNHLCTSFYGTELWANRKRIRGLLKQLAVSYHYALKRVMGLPKWSSNHYTCSLLNCLTFEHCINLKTIKFYFWLVNCSSPCFERHKVYIIKFSRFFLEIDKLCRIRYQLVNFWDNDVDALRSMMFFVQSREPSSYVNNE